MHPIQRAKKIYKRWRKLIFLYLETLKDARRFLHSGNPKQTGTNDLAISEGDIVRNYHVIEKGLSMPEFRPGFGKDQVNHLVSIIQKWECKKHPLDNRQYQAAKGVLAAYRERHEKIDHPAAGRIPKSLLPHDSICGGTKPYVPALPSDLDSFARIVRSRSSVRSFIPSQSPDPELVNLAIDDARWSPSVCNRQTARVHLYTGDQALELLRYQSGNRGFGHRVPLLIIVTSDLRYFSGINERNQGWIDGGMFSMLLLLGLHARGLGAVALNWSVVNQTDAAIRKPSGIPEHERIIMMIGCGVPEPSCVVPVSARRSVTEIAKWH
jgi:nitroreductase